MEAIKEPIVVEQVFNQSVDTVWDAITQVDKMTQWFFENIESFEPEIGFETQFNIVSGSRNFLHLWKITEVVPLKKIAYSWEYDGYDGDSVVSFELFEEGETTKLRVSHLVLDVFPQDVPEFSRESCLVGWNYFIGERLKEFLGKDC